MRPRRLVAAHTALPTFLPTSKAARDVDDGRAGAKAMGVGCSVDVRSDAAPEERRQAWSARLYVYCAPHSLRFAGTCFVDTVEPPLTF